MRKYMSKRQRPCDFCRSRKQACRIENSPPCRLCQLHGRECTFVEVARPRKRTAAEAQTASLSMGIEDIRNASQGYPANPRMDGTQDAIDGGELSSELRLHEAIPVQSPNATVSPGVPLSHSSFPDMTIQFLQDLDMDGSEYHFMFRTPGSPPSRASVIGDADFLSPHSGQSCMPSPEFILDGIEGANPEILGTTGDMDPYLLQHYKTDDRGVFKFKQLAIHSVLQDPFPTQFLVSHPSLFAKSKEETGHSDIKDAKFREKLEAVVSREMGKRLIALYQKFIAPQYPIFSTCAIPDPSSSPVYLLAVIYSITFPFAMYDDQLCIDLAYDAFPYSTVSHIINSTLAADQHSPSLALVQTALLMVIRPSINPLVSDASYRWSIFGTLLTSATNIGLHLDPSSWKIPPWQTAQRRRLSLIIFFTDKWLASSLGRPPMINDANWLVTYLMPSDQLGSSLSERQWADLMRLSSMTGVLDSTLLTLYSLRSSLELRFDPTSEFRTSDVLIQELDKAFSILDESCNKAEDDSHAMLETVAKLGYVYIKLTILRATLRLFLNTGPSVVSEAEKYTEIRLQSRKNMHQCVGEFLGIVRSLKTESINGIWPPWCQTAFSSFCFMILMMIVSSDDVDDASWWVKLLHSTRKELRIKAGSFSVLRLGLLRIDSLFWRGIDKVLNLPPHVMEAFAFTQSAA